MLDDVRCNSRQVQEGLWCRRELRLKHKTFHFTSVFNLAEKLTVESASTVMSGTSSGSSSQ